MVKKNIPLATAILSFTIGAFVMAVLTNFLASAGEGEEMPARTIEDVLKEHTNELMSISGVVGTGQGLCDGEPCIKVFVIKKTTELLKKIPHNLEGYPVKVEETGPIRALPKNLN